MEFLRKYRHPSDLPGHVPLFPLSGVILLPRAHLPLNVFEPRYLDLVEAALAGNRILGIVQPTGEGGKTGSPQGKSAPLCNVGSAGRLTSYQELPDGRMAIVLTGVCRFDLLGEVPSQALYRMGSVSYDRFAGDLVTGLGEDDVNRDHFLAVLKRYLDARNLTTDWEAIKRSSSEALVNSFSMMSPYQAKEKQALLEAADLKTRAEVLAALAEFELASDSGEPGSTLQ